MDKNIRELLKQFDPNFNHRHDLPVDSLELYRNRNREPKNFFMYGKHAAAPKVNKAPTHVAGQFVHTPPPVALKPAKSDQQKFLEKFGCNPSNLEQENQHGVTPLTVAIEQGNHTRVKELLAAGADVTHMNSKGNAPLDLAKSRNTKHADHQMLVIVETALQNIVWPFVRDNGFNMNNFNTFNLHKSTALTVAVEKGTPQLVRALVQLGADPTYANGHGNTALTLAKKRLERKGYRDMLDIIEPAVAAQKHVRNHKINLKPK